MKLKPILIASTCVVLLVGVFLFVRSKTSFAGNKSEISQFLNGFNNRIKEGNRDSLLAYFEVETKPKALKRLIGLLTGKQTMDGKEKPLAGVSLDVDASKITMGGSGMITADIPAKFTHDSLTDKPSVLTLKIRAIAPHQYKIVQVDARKFLTDYSAYANFVRSKTLSDKDLFSPITLAAFKTAGQLKAKYDSVIWFAHVDGKTFFYVVKGKWDMGKDINHYKDSVVEPYKMGLVSPELKEIIPVEYDLIHNINGTFPGLVEVEKDNKKGFYNLDGKLVVPVNYDQIFPLDGDLNLAVLRNGNDYFYLKKDTTVSDKVDLKINDFFSKIKGLANAYDLYKNALNVVTEYNSKDDKGAIYIPPSYLVDLGIISKQEEFKNPLRPGEYEEVHEKYEVAYSGKSSATEGWLEASFYSIRDYFLGGRSEFYDTKNIVIVDKKHDRVLTHEVGTDYSPGDGGGELFTGRCNINSIKAINDSLFEIAAGATLEFDLYDSTKTVTGGPYYHYLAIKDNKLKELKNDRNFGFTKYVKMDDSYLLPCYRLLEGKGLYGDRARLTLDHVTPEMLRYMKNEIYADYGYQFKDKRWNDVFGTIDSYFDSNNGSRISHVNVDDSLTEIDKYNINWIVQKLKGAKVNASTLAAK